MVKRSLMVGCMFLCLISGCGAVEVGVSDISGWDLSACADDFDAFDVCSELFFDNEEKILGGRTLIEVLLGGVEE